MGDYGCKQVGKWEGGGGCIVHMVYIYTHIYHTKYTGV